MGWLRRLRRARPPADEPQEEAVPVAVERAAPGIAALLSGLREDGSHAVLDMGPAAEGSFRLYSRFARRIRFADLLTPPSGTPWAAALADVPSYRGHAYDVVVAWDLLDRMAPGQRHLLIDRLVELTTPAARLYVVVDQSGQPTVRPVRSTVLEVDRVSQEPASPPHRAWPAILPAEVERLLRPFEVVQAFVLRQGIREYVAIRR